MAEGPELQKRQSRFLGPPRTGLGRASLWLILVFVALFVLWQLEARLPRDRSTFFSDPLMAFLIICTACAGNACWVTSILSFAFKREKSVLLLLPFALGAFVLIFTIGELLGG